MQAAVCSPRHDRIHDNKMSSKYATMQKASMTYWHIDFNNIYSQCKWYTNIIQNPNSF